MAHKSNDWIKISGLYLLGTISILSGVLQLELLNTGLVSGDSSHDPDSPHYYLIPIPVILHIVAGVLFNLVSPLQFSSKIRNAIPQLHKISGMMLSICAIVAGVTAFIMNEIYPAFGGLLKYSGVMAFALSIIFCTFMGLRKIKQGKTQEHRAWMIRATAVALGPATQRLFFIPAFLILGEVSQLVIGIGVWLGFLINLVIAELLIIPNKPKNTTQNVTHSLLQSR